MPPLPSSAAQAARKALAARLREILKVSGLNGRELAARAGWHPAKTSRILNAITPATEDDIRAWCLACGAEDEIGDLLAAMRNAESAYLSWKRLHRTGLSKVYETSTPLFERTRSFRVYGSNVVPGLLQTTAYASALLTWITEFQGTPNDVDEAVRARMKRSDVIRHGDHRFSIIVEEDVLRHRIGDTSVMTGQLGYLLEAMTLPSVSLGIIPHGVPRSGIWPVEAFYIYDEVQASVETLSASVTITSPGEIATYAKAHRMLADIAVKGRAATHLITAAIEAL